MFEDNPQAKRGRSSQLCRIQYGVTRYPKATYYDLRAHQAIKVPAVVD